MLLDVRTQEKYIELAAEGRIDASTVQDFEEKALSIAKESSVALVVNFAGVAYISSAGLRAVLKLAKLSQSRKIKLICCGMQPAVFEVFKISGFSSIITIVDSLESAVSSL